MFCNWRDCQEYRSLGLPLSTTSNEACKLYDATLTQYVGWYDDDSMGGLENCVAQMLSADPQFVMGHVLKNGLDLMGTGRSVALDTDFKRDIDAMVTLSDSGPINQREQLHVQAIKLWADGQMRSACDKWETILVDNPLDMLAIKFAHDAYFYLGLHPQLRDSPARCLPNWKPSMPLYSDLLGIYSFGLEETNLYSQAEKVARQSLEMKKQSAWSTHTLCHVMEMEGRQNEGIGFLSRTLNDWTKCGMLACHNFWHWALYHIEKNEHQGALDIFDTEIAVSLKKSGAMLDVVDVCSLLYRLELEGIDVGSRWNDTFEIIRPHVEDHILAFNDVHIMMACLGSNSKEIVQKMMDSLRGFIRDGSGDNHDLTRDIGMPMCEAFLAYDEGDYGKAVELLLPLRYDVIKIGGSHAQRDIFNLLLIHAALKSDIAEHKKLARHLLMERKALKENSPMTDRLIAKAMATHVD
ncbi:tetratricopeptide repeat protein 38-like [Liolophura sinensis]|uniref:tetratricopeptide repeat protein 38-like n=1 Tax=Liolophura sinensis TaxID=3198878 RepID=UPI003158E10A